MSEALTITNISSSTSDISTVTLKQTGGVTDEYEYCFVGYDVWQDLIYDTPVVVGFGKAIRVRAKNPITERSDTRYIQLHTDAETGGSKMSLSGNVNSMLAPDFEDIVDISEHPYAFSHLFHGCGNVFDASELELPATTLSDYCYYGMFQACALESTPKLPATVLTKGCYSHMFRSCLNLVVPPKLPATTLAEECYYMMLSRCAIKIPPALPATTLPSRCYSGMFQESGYIGVSKVETDEYVRPYRIPAKDFGTAAYNALVGMFESTDGPVDTPIINTTYYLRDPNPPQIVTVKYKNEDGATIHADDTFEAYDPDIFVPTPIHIMNYMYDHMERTDEVEWVLTYKKIHYREGVYHWTGTDWKLDADVGIESFETYYQKDEPTEGDEGDFWVYGGDA